MNRAQIKEIFLEHGFTVKEGQSDLKEYVYQAAEALLQKATGYQQVGYMRWQNGSAEYVSVKRLETPLDSEWHVVFIAAEQPATQQEPVAHLPCCGYTDTSALQWNPYNGVAQCHNCGQVYAAPQPARQPLTEEQIAESEREACAALADRAAAESHSTYGHCISVRDPNSGLVAAGAKEQAKKLSEAIGARGR